MYPSLPLAINPVSHSAWIPVPVFRKYHFWRKGIWVQWKWSNTNDNDLRIENDSAYKGFD